MLRTENVPVSLPSRRRRGLKAPHILRAEPPATTLGEQLFVIARDAIVVVEPYSSRIMRWNPAAEQFFGYSALEAIGRPIDMLMPRAAARLERQRIAHYLRTGDPGVLTGAGPHCIPVLDRDSVELRAQLSVAPIEAPGLPTRSILLTFRDASCEQRAELRTREAAHAMAAVDQTERQLRRYQQLLCDRPRDLERPVSQARRSAARLARLAARPVGQIEPERLALLAQVVERRTENVQRILQHLSDAALIEVGSFQLATERVNLVPVVSRVVAECRARAQAHRLNLGAPQGLTCECDVSRIESVLRDLLERAIRRNPRGCWIDVDLRRPLVGLAQVEVRDYGRSMSIREREGLMRASVADRGWSVHRYIVEQHGGSLEVDFPAEGGVRAVVSMPTHRGKLGRAS